MRFLPSIPAAIVAGAVVTPLALVGLSLAELKFHLPMSPISVACTVIIPLTLAVTDLRPLRDWRFGVEWMAEARFRSIIPELKRAALYFISLLTSLLILDYLGLGF